MALGRLCAVSVDLDGIEIYRRLHGLEPLERGRHAVMDVALPRALAFGAAHRLPLTLFVVGRDLARPRTAEAVRAAARGGATVESHSFSHRQELSRQPPPALLDDLERAAGAITDVTERRPLGFRAPGYLVSDALLAAAERCGALYDASSFPCPVYYLAKLAAMAALHARGRHSAAAIDDPRTQLAPRGPHWRGGLVEIPMAVTRRLRLPVIGTSLTMAGARAAGALVGGCVGDAVVSLELHGLDFLDVRDELGDLAPSQWDVTLPLERKLAALGAAVRVLAAAGYRFVSLAEAAAAWRAEHPRRP